MHLMNSQNIDRNKVLALIFAVAVMIFILFNPGLIERFKELGYVGAFFAMFFAYATVVIPAPGFLIILFLGATLPNPLLVGVLGAAGATLGELVGYMVGYSGSDIFHKSPTYKKIEKFVHKYGLPAITFFAFIPNPLFDLVGLVAGILKIKWWKFLIAVGIGMLAKTIIVAYAGAYSIGWIEKLIL